MAMTSAAALMPINTAPQIEPANFLNLLIVDDERAIREACREVAISLGYSAYMADSAEQAFRALDAQNFDAVLLDLRLPGGGGLDALRRIKERRPEAVVVVVTGFGTVQSAVQAMKNGAYDYVTKPFSVEELKLLLDRVASHLKLKSENRMLREKVKSKQGYGGIVGRGQRYVFFFFFFACRVLAQLRLRLALLARAGVCAPVRTSSAPPSTCGRRSRSKASRARGGARASTRHSAHTRAAQRFGHPRLGELWNTFDRGYWPGFAQQVLRPALEGASFDTRLQPVPATPGTLRAERERPARPAGERSRPSTPVGRPATAWPAGTPAQLRAAAPPLLGRQHRSGPAQPARPHAAPTISGAPTPVRPSRRCSRACCCGRKRCSRG